jgi:AcrR family transcriptional regulator
MSAERTRVRILAAAAELISEEGIDEVRIARVANRAGVSTSLVHHYFSTREEPLADALMLAFDQAAEERFGAEEPAIAKRSHTDALAVAVEQCLPGEGPDQREWVLWVELWLRAARDPELRPVAALLYERYRVWMQELIEAGVEAGEFSTDDPARVADLALGLFDGLGLRALLEDPAVDLKRARRLIARTLAAELDLEPADLDDVDIEAGQR